MPVYRSALISRKSTYRLFTSCKVLQNSPPKRLHYDTDLNESFKIWYEELSNYDDGDTISQDKFLNYILPYYKSNELVEDQDKSIRAYNIKTHLKPIKKADLSDNNQWYLNEIRIEKGSVDDRDASTHLVMLHGYGASSGWFYKNFAGIMENCGNTKNLTIHGIDMLGFGLSGRPNIKYKYDLSTKSSLEIQTAGIKWGKYSTCLKCGGHLDGKENRKNHWCSCADEEEELRKGHEIEGKHANVIIKKEDIVDYLKNHKELIKEVEDIYIESLEKWRIMNKIDKFDLLAHSLGGYLGFAYLLKYPHRVNKVVMVSPGGVERSPFAISNPEYLQLCKDGDKTGDFRMLISNLVDEYGFLGRYGLISKNFRNLWNMRFSIFTILRWLGPFGPKVLINRNADKFTKSGNIQDEKEIELFLKYIYSCSIRQSFSETSIMRIFDATIVGKYPILDKIRDDGAKIKDKEILWIYGEHDFMYKNCGVDAMKAMNKLNEEKPGGDGEDKSQFKVIKNAGHNLYLDNSTDFNREVIRFLKY